MRFRVDCHQHYNHIGWYFFDFVVAHSQLYGHVTMVNVSDQMIEGNEVDTVNEGAS